MSQPLDLTSLTDEDLRSRYRELGDELSRRHELSTAPARVREICERHCEIGGDPQVLADEIHTVATEHEQAMMAEARQEVEKEKMH